MTTTISLVNNHHPIQLQKKKNVFFPCDENLQSTLLTTFEYTVNQC